MVVTTTSREGLAGAGFRDLVSLLRPSAGLVESHSIEPPSSSTMGMWRIAIRLACDHHGETGSGVLPPCVTGAAAPTRSEALLRALGESVERIALHRADGLDATTSELAGDAFTGTEPDVALCAFDPDVRTRWYPARHVRSGRSVFAPSGLVDYPGPADCAGFDPGPSGCASGFGYDSALRSALLETIERDAVLVSWARQLRLRAVDLDGSQVGGDRQVCQLLGQAAAGEISPRVAEVPISVPGVRCVVGGFRVETIAGPVICVGAKTSEQVSTSVTGALSESLQLLQHLVATRIERAGIEPPSTISGDEERLWFLASDRGADALEGWFADQAPPSEPESGERLTGAELLRLTMDDGLDPLVIELTDRIPAAARDMGWSVVKVVPKGYQPLRVDETHAAGWNLGRLRSAAHRTGVAARLDCGQRGWAPHPLP